MMKPLFSRIAVSLFLGLTALVAQAQTITFIHFNDLHAHLTPHLDVIRDEQGNVHYEERGGLARLDTLIKQIRAENPDSVLMNVGDTTHGGVEALFTNGNAVIDPVNALGIDVGVPGNWDYAYGPDVFRLRYVENLGPMEKRMLGIRGAGDIQRFNFPNLAANVTFTFPFYKAGKTILPPTLSKTIGGVKVGFIGLTSDIVPLMHKMLAVGMDFKQGELAHREIVQKYAHQLRNEGAQIVVVMSELGLQKDKQLADGLEPGLVNVVFSAHTHETVFKPIVTRSGTRVVEAGNDGWLGRMDISVDNGNVTGYHWKLLPVDDKIKPDPAMQALVDKARAPFLKEDPNMVLKEPGIHLELHQSIATVIGHVAHTLERRNSLESSFNDAWADALRRGENTDLAMTPGFRFDAVVPGYEDAHAAKGDITIEDAFRYFPVPYTLGQAKVNGKRLESILEDALSSVYSPDAFAQHGGWVDGISGLHVDLDLSAPDGKRVKSIRLADGAPLQKDHLYTVAGCLRPMDDPDVMCSKSGFVDVKPFMNPQTGEPWQVVDYFEYVVKNGWLGDGRRHDMNDVSKRPQWPQAPYVQPLAAGVKTAPPEGK